MRMNPHALLAALLLCECGSSTPSPASNEGDGAAGDLGCPSGDVYCAGCHGGGFCSTHCPAVACPAMAASDEGSSSGGADSSSGSSSGLQARAGDARTPPDATSLADATAEGGNGCPSGMPNYCADCNGGGFCVSGGCPVATCPVRDAGTDAAPPDSSTSDVSIPSVPCGADGGCVAPNYCFVLSCGGGAQAPGTPACTPPPPVCAPLSSECADGGGSFILTCPAPACSPGCTGIYNCPGASADRRIQCGFQ